MVAVSEKQWIHWTDSEKVLLCEYLFKKKVFAIKKGFVDEVRMAQDAVLPKTRRRPLTQFHVVRKFFDYYKNYREDQFKLTEKKEIEETVKTSVIEKKVQEVSSTEEKKYTISELFPTEVGIRKLIDMNQQLMRTIVEMKQEMEDKISFLCEYITELDRPLNADEVSEVIKTEPVSNLKISVVKKKLLLLGANADQQASVKNVYDQYFDIVCFHEPTASVKEHVKTSDVVVMMTKFIGHAFYHTVKNIGGKKVVLANGGADSVKQFLSSYVVPPPPLSA